MQCCAHYNTALTHSPLPPCLDAAPRAALHALAQTEQLCAPPGSASVVCERPATAPVRSTPGAVSGASAAVMMLTTTALTHESTSELAVAHVTLH
jgi:hypothetical protein